MSVRRGIRLKGRLFVFEGPDGVGKTTLSELAAGLLVEAGAKAHHLSFPGRDAGSVGRLVYDFHHSDHARCVHPTAVQALHVAAHVDAIERHIAPRLADGVHVVLDRYWWSAWVYGITAGVEAATMKLLLDFESQVWGRVAPTTVFLVRRAAPLCRPNEPMPRWKRLQAEYKKLASRESAKQPVEVVDNGGDITNSMHQVMSRIANGLDRSQRRLVLKAAAEFVPHPSPPAEPSRVYASALTASDGRGPMILLHLQPAKPTQVFDTYWRFAAERQNIFFQRAAGCAEPWTSDPILREYKFTNAYRASDRVSQYLIRNVIYRDDLPDTPEEVLFRIILFKLFNKIETWKLLEDAIGPISYREYSYDRYERVLDEAMRSGRRIYSAAYIMPTGGHASTETRKHRLHLRLVERMMSDGLPRRVAAASSMSAVFDLLLAYPTIGPFLAYQFATDINYSNLTQFSELDLVVPGPGALDGLKKCFASLGGLAPAEAIKFMADIQEREFERLGLRFEALWGRSLQLIDCQNLFCEVDKYSRVAHPEVLGVSGRTRIKQRFQKNDEPIDYWYPPKWKLNGRIASWLSDRRKTSTASLGEGNDGTE